MVAFATRPPGVLALAGSFTGSPCTLSGSGASATCQVSYTPGQAGRHNIAGTYTGAGAHSSSTGSATLLVPGKWTLQAAVAAPGASATGLSGVSCQRFASGHGHTHLVDLCIGVGDFVNGSGVEMTFAEQFGAGDYSFPGSTPNPAGASSSGLRAVSCRDRNACLAVGGFVDSAGHPRTLGETWNGVESNWWRVGTPSGGRLDACRAGRATNNASPSATHPTAPARTCRWQWSCCSGDGRCRARRCLPAPRAAASAPCRAQARAVA